MPWPQFLAYTAAGSLIWNSLLIGLGVALGDVVDEYLHYLDYVIYAAVVGVVGWLVLRAVEERGGRGRRTPPRRHAADRVVEVHGEEEDRAR